MPKCEENPSFKYNEMDLPQVAEPDDFQEDESKPTTSVCNSLTIALSFFVGIISILLAVLFVLLSKRQTLVFQVQAQTEEMKQEVYLGRTKLSDLKSEISRLETEPTYWNRPYIFERAFTKNMDGSRWTKFSNGLYYKFCVSDIKIDFAYAEKECKKQEAQLASTGIRNSTIRSEIFTRLSRRNTKTWIGLNQPYDNTTWVWSDGKLYDNADMPWDESQICSRMRGCGAIYWRSYNILNCYQPIADVHGYICERSLYPVLQP